MLLQPNYVSYTGKTAPVTSSGKFWLSIARRNPWLGNWIDYADRSKPNRSSSSTSLLKHHRHGCSAHRMENYVETTVIRLPIGSPRWHNLTAQPITRGEVLDLYSYSYPEFTFKTYDACEREGLAGYLNINDLFHVPTWYS